MTLTLYAVIRRSIPVALAAGVISGCAAHPKPALPTSPSPPPTTSAPSHYSAPPPSAVATEPLPGTIQDFASKAGDRIYFDYDQYTVRDDARDVLAAQAQWLSRYPSVQVRIEGNADERGTEEYNLALGGRRAAAVQTYLVEHGIDPSRISTISYGKERPIDPGADETAWSHNRNAHTDITAGAH